MMRSSTFSPRKLRVLLRGFFQTRNRFFFFATMLSGVLGFHLELSAMGSSRHFPGNAQDERIFGGSGDDFSYSSYFELMAPANETQVDLLKFHEVNEPLPQPKEAYNRKTHFGTWIDDPRDQGCLNTRAKVLQRDALGKVEFGGNRQCVVSKGHWRDPYTNKLLNSPMEVQVDHFVPLKHAFITGAFEWDQQHRCLYANYLGNSFHLLSVSGTANEEKSDKSPAEFLPSNKAYVCQYLVQWLKVKAIWNLRLTPVEVDSIQKSISDYSCNRNDFKMSNSEYHEQQIFIENNLDLCANRN